MEAFRQFLKGWLGKLLLVIFLAPLALLGIDSYFTSGKSNDVVASVGDITISNEQYNRTLAKEKQRLTQQLGPSAALLDEAKLKKQVLENLIDKSALEGKASELGLSFSDAQISAMIKKDPTFHDASGQFSQSRFEALLKSNHLDKRILFNDIRKQSALSQLTQSLSQTAIFPLSQVDALIKLEKEHRHVQVHRVSAESFADKVTVSEKDITAYYEANKDALKTQKTIDLEYVVLRSDKFANAVVADTTLQSLYDAKVVELAKNDTRQARHILFTGEKAKEQAANALARIKKGEDFAALAKELTADDSSKENGGLLDFTARGVFDPEFDKALFSMKKGDLSDVVTTQYGSHVIRLEDIQAAPVPSLEEMKGELVKQAQLRQQENDYQDAIKRINDAALNGTSVKDIAQDESLTAEVVKDFTDSAINPATLMGKTELMHPDVMKKAFDEFALTDQTTSVGITVAPNATVWIQSKSYRPVRLKTLDEAKKEIKALLVNKKAMSLAEANVKTLVAKINATKDLTAASQSLNANFEDLGDLSRQKSGLSPAETIAVFSTKLVKDTPVAISEKTEDGYSVFAVREPKEQHTITITDEERKQYTDAFIQIQGEQQFMDYVEYAKTSLKVEKNDDLLNKSASGS